MTRLQEIKERCEKAKLDLVIYSENLDEVPVSSESGEIKVFNPGPNPIFEDMQWLISQVEKAIEVAEYYGSLARWSYKSPDNEIQQGKKARELLKQIKELA